MYTVISSDLLVEVLEFVRSEEDLYADRNLQIEIFVSSLFDEQDKHIPCFEIKATADFGRGMNVVHKKVTLAECEKFKGNLLKVTIEYLIATLYRC